MLLLSGVLFLIWNDLRCRIYRTPVATPHAVQFLLFFLAEFFKWYEFFHMVSFLRNPAGDTVCRVHQSVSLPVLYHNHPTNFKSSSNFSAKNVSFPPPLKNPADYGILKVLGKLELDQLI